MCCLGHLCDVADPSGWQLSDGYKVKAAYVVGERVFDISSPFLREVMLDFNECNGEQASLVRCNDGDRYGQGRCTLSQIADLVEHFIPEEPD